MGMAAQCAGARLVAMAPADGRTHQGVRRDCDASVPRNNQAKAPVTVRAGMLVRWATKRQPQQRRSGGRPKVRRIPAARGCVRGCGRRRHNPSGQGAVRKLGAPMERARWATRHAWRLPARSPSKHD